jgi:hypothetical protein
MDLFVKGFLKIFLVDYDFSWWLMVCGVRPQVFSKVFWWYQKRTTGFLRFINKEYWTTGFLRFSGGIKKGLLAS